jgi:hypothetical protein
MDSCAHCTGTRTHPGKAHPDREPDPHERERKTALMQRANHAYGKNDLLKLLELQLELEHIDQPAYTTLDDCSEFSRLRLLPCALSGVASI